MTLLLETVYFSTIRILTTLLSPHFWIVVCIVLFQYIKAGKVEKDILGDYKRTPFLNTLSSVVYGFIGGILGSILFIHFNVLINQRDFLFILPLALILSMINSRFICFSYAGGIISLSSLILGWPQVNVASIMFVIGVLHLIESVLILLDGTSSKVPIFMEKEGQIVGGFVMNRFWPVPFLLFINGGIIKPATLLAILGYGDISFSSLPEEKAKETSFYLFLFSITLMFLSKRSQTEYIYRYAASIFAPVAHEIIVLLGKFKEERGRYFFQPSSNGLKVLDTMPGSIGEKMGFNSGDVILSINGKRILSKEDVEEILYYSPRTLWIDVLDRKNGYISKEYRCYDREGIKSLGVIVVSEIPDGQLVVEEAETPVIRFLNKFRRKKWIFRN
jgi:hypothetical protein